MKVYEVVFADPEQGFIRTWQRNKRDIKALLSAWGKSYPLREHMTTTLVEVPTDKARFVKWLNINANRKVNEKPKR